jgi:hypothetical protein
VTANRSFAYGDSAEPQPRMADARAGNPPTDSRVRSQPDAMTTPHQPSPARPLGTIRYRGTGPTWWFLGCHGGAGTTTLTAAVPGGMDAGRYWPVPDPPTFAYVVLVARGHAGGLQAAQAASRQWASGTLPTVRLLGLAVVADAPGRRPKPLREFLQLISGGLPRVWDLPWVEALRLGDPPDQVPLPRPFPALAADLHHIVTGGARV